MKNQKKRNFFRKTYTDSWNYIKNSKNFIYAAILIFFIFTLMGFFIQPPPDVESRILEFIAELLAKTQGMGHLELISFIFFNNVQSSFTGLFFGVVLGIFSGISALANGYILGFVASRVSEGASLSVLWRLLPHGIFELPALVISLGLGIKLGTFVFNKKKIKTLENYLLNSFKVFVFIVIPLLIVAAIIEGTLIFIAG